jgi:hypothetical protein
MDPDLDPYLVLMDPDLDPYLVLMDPDPGGPKHTDLTNPAPDPGPRHWIKIVYAIPCSDTFNCSLSFFQHC